MKLVVLSVALLDWPSTGSRSSTQFCPHIAAGGHPQTIGPGLDEIEIVIQLLINFEMFNLVCEVDVVGKKGDSRSLVGDKKTGSQNPVIRPSGTLDGSLKKFLDPWFQNCSPDPDGAALLASDHGDFEWQSRAEVESHIKIGMIAIVFGLVMM